MIHVADVKRRYQVREQIRRRAVHAFGELVALLRQEFYHRRHAAVHGLVQNALQLWLLTSSCMPATRTRVRVDYLDVIHP